MPPSSKKAWNEENQQTRLHSLCKLTTCLNSYSIIHFQQLVESRSGYLSLANQSLREHSSALHRSSCTHLAAREVCYQNTYSLSKRCSGTVGRCTYLSKLQILLDGDVIWVELTPASHIIKRTIKKLIMFGKSLFIPCWWMCSQDSFKQVSKLHVRVTVLQPPAWGILKYLGWVRLEIQLSSNVARSLKAILQQLIATLETSFKDLYQKRQRLGSCNLWVSDLLQVTWAGRNSNM